VVVPLAERLRPRVLGDVLGQDHLLGPDGPLGRMVASARLTSLILWGPPGTGKTSIARLLAEACGLRFVGVSAVFTGVAELKAIFAEARAQAGPTLLFVDEIHRFNRAQQDGFLGPVEAGNVVLVGATTENPSFALNAALLSRAQVLVVRRLDVSALEALLARVEAEVGHALPLEAEARAALVAGADGDGRFLLGQVETLLAAAPDHALGAAELGALLQRRMLVYDKDQDGHYGLISALHKSLRGSDPDAALYWLARMLEAGEEPLYLLRRLVRFASEDVGLADPQALVIAMAAVEAYRMLGSPEGELAIVEVCLYLATAPKSNAAYKAEKAARRLARSTGSLAPPDHILNAPTKLMKEMGRGKGYEYDHDAPDGFSAANYWPDGVRPERLYQPSPRGLEVRLAERMAEWDRRRAARRTAQREGA
jgi:putative ATPase